METKENFKEKLKEPSYTIQQQWRRIFTKQMLQRWVDLLRSDYYTHLLNLWLVNLYKKRNILVCWSTHFLIYCKAVYNLKKMQNCILKSTHLFIPVQITQIFFWILSYSQTCAEWCQNDLKVNTFFSKTYINTFTIWSIITEELPLHPSSGSLLNLRATVFAQRKKRYSGHKESFL